MSGPWEKYQPQPEAGPWTKYQAPAPAAAPQEPTTVGGVASNLLKGAASGIADVGDTILNAAAYLPGKVIPAVKEWNDDRTASLQDFNDANKDSTAFSVGRTGANIAATLPVGGVLAAGAKAVGAAPAVVQALGSSGMKAAGMGGAKGLALRAGAGAATGAASTALVDPDSAGTGAIIGGALPVVTKGLGAVGNAASRAVKGPAVPAATVDAARTARTAGYVLPPTMVKPSLLNRVIEGTAGKASTAQAVSTRNQTVSNDLVRKALGLAPDAELTPEALDAIRKEAGKAYEAVSSVGPINAAGVKLPGDVAVNRFTDNLTLAPRAEVDAGELVRAWRQANADATAFFRSYGRTADPEMLTKARNASAAAKQIDAFMGTRLQEMGRGDLLDALKAARIRIAKTHTAEAALNPATGNIDATNLAKQVAKGKPLSGEMRQAGDFARAFPKAAQMPEKIGSQPGISPLDIGTAAVTSTLLESFLPLSGLALRPVARAVALSGPVQNSMTAPAAAIGQGRLGPTPATREALGLLFARGAPVLGAR